ncbi:MAG: molybdate ABC transporter substrate-binding protein [Gammaproteobacteria bacterium]|nr:molybdate ABC transporter substrate-binding protein [Gammaproteobacteria bacterium]
MKLLASAALLLSTAAGAAEAVVAVAANFLPVLEILVDDFGNSTPHSVRITSGSTGKLHAQIMNGAPFDVFLSADSDTVIRLEKSGNGVAGTRFTYANGRLALWIREPYSLREDIGETLRQDGIRHIAIANPALAPYGRAAIEVLGAVGNPEEFADRIVMGENVAQAFAYVATGNADAGLVALSNMIQANGKYGGAWAEVPPDLYSPIRQDALLLRHGADNEAATAFLAFLASDAARTRIAASGYGAD